MATYDGWTEIREYRVWSGADIWQTTTVLKHSNGWFSVETDGIDEPYKTRYESKAYRQAKLRTEKGVSEAIADCPCQNWDQEDREECESSAYNPYGYPHGVRVQYVDVLENRELEEHEL